MVELRAEASRITCGNLGENVAFHHLVTQSTDVSESDFPEESVLPSPSPVGIAL